MAPESNVDNRAGSLLVEPVEAGGVLRPEMADGPAGTGCRNERADGEEVRVVIEDCWFEVRKGVAEDELGLVGRLDAAHHVVEDWLLVVWGHAYPEQVHCAHC